MDKKLILAVAGAGKTTYIVDKLDLNKRSLIITYTNANYINIVNKVMQKFDGIVPNNIVIYTYFKFLYNFCYKPFLADEIKAKGIIFDDPPKYIRKGSIARFINKGNKFYSSRLSLFLREKNVKNEIIDRLCRYFDEFIIDEVQDISAGDFNLLKDLMVANINMLFVGDFYQHTYATSHDGNVNKSLYDDIDIYLNQCDLLPTLKKVGLLRAQDSCWSQYQRAIPAGPAV